MQDRSMALELPDSWPDTSTQALSVRVRKMAQRWRYSTTELAEVMKLTRLDPDRWSAAIALDEEREAEFRAAGMIL